MGDILKRSNFFIGEIKNVVLTCLRLETRSNIHYFWSFIMQSDLYRFSFCGPGALLPHFNLREQVILFISVIHPWGYFKKKQFFHRWDQKRCFNLSTLRNTFQHSLLLKFHHAIRSLSIFFLRPWCTSTPFYTKRARYSLHLSDSSMEEFLKRSNFFTVETKIGFILSTLRNRFQHLLLLKFHHALNNFIKLRFAALVLFYSVSPWESKVFCSSQWFTQWGYFEKKQYFS